MLTSLWDLSNLPPNVKAVIGVPRAAMTARPSDRAPIEQRIASTLGVLVGQVLALSRGGTRPNRSFRFLVLPGTALALVGLAVFGLRFSSAEIGPKAPPLTDLEAALSGPDPLMTKVAARTDSPAAPSPRATNMEIAPAVAAIHTRLPEDLGAAQSAALAVEAEPAAINRLVDVRRGDTLMKLLVDAGIDRRQAHEAITALTEVFSPRKLRPGQSIRLALAAPATNEQENGTAGRPQLISLSLSPNAEEDVHVVREGDEGTYVARTEARPLDRRLSAYSGTIDSSLFVAARGAGMPTDVVVEMIRLFSFDVDFQREIQPGDSFEVLYDSYYDRAGALAKTGPLRYGAMMLSGKRLEFYHFVAADGTDDHFDPNGRSVRRTLLRTPVDGARISSGYGKRKHPIQGYTKMHRGVDFAAPRGTPIYAAGHGVVERIGRHGGYGKYIRIRHNSTYKTAYAHLKSYAKGLNRGARVKQGQVIGYVGSTGNSTGPHLHYEVFYDNKQVNPLKVKLASGKKLAGADLEAFQTARAEADRLRGEALGKSLLAETGCGNELPFAMAAGSGTSAELPAPGRSGC